MIRTISLAIAFAVALGGSAPANDSFFGIIPKALAGKEGTARITCREGKKFLRSKGYEVTLAVDCKPRFYTYSAMRQGQSYIVTVDSRYPRISSASKDH
jgi:hypothetical protein